MIVTWIVLDNVEVFVFEIICFSDYGFALDREIDGVSFCRVEKHESYGLDVGFLGDKSCQFGEVLNLNISRVVDSLFDIV